MSIAPALAEVFEFATKAPPPLDLPRLERGRAIGAAGFLSLMRDVRLLVETYEPENDGWMREWPIHLETLKRAATSARTEKHRREFSDVLGKQILIVERIADDAAALSDRVRTLFTRAKPVVSSHFPAISADFQRAFASLLDMTDKRVALYLEVALCSRALRAELDDNRGDGQIFEDPDALRAFLADI